MQLSILITGSNRGIGLELVKQLLTKKNPKYIFATCRNPDKAKALKQLAAKHPSIKIMKLDVTNDDTIDDAVQQVTTFVGDDGLGVLINNAGQGSKVSFETMNRSIIHEVLNTNTTGPLIVTQKFLYLLKKAAASTIAFSWQNSILNMSSGLGSIGDNNSGGAYAYRASKAALNMMSRSLSVDLKSDKIMVVSLSPGWVQTDMGGPIARLTVEECVKRLLTVMDSLTAKENGQVITHTGSVLEY